MIALSSSTVSSFVHTIQRLNQRARRPAARRSAASPSSPPRGIVKTAAKNKPDEQAGARFLDPEVQQLDDGAPKPTELGPRAGIQQMGIEGREPEAFRAEGAEARRDGSGYFSDHDTAWVGPRRRALEFSGNGPRRERRS